MKSSNRFYCAAFGALSICSLLAKADERSEKVVRLFGGGSGDCSETVVELRAGDTVPFQFSLRGDILSFDSDAIASAKVERNVFLKVSCEEEILLSYDGMTFIPVSEALSGRISANAVGTEAGVIQSVQVVGEVFRHRSEASH